jgi:hypothetical protein
MPFEEIADGGNRPDRVEESLVIPAADARVEDGVREGEEQLDVGVDPIFVGPMMVPACDILAEEVPVPGRQLGARPIRPVLGDHLLLVGETGAEGEEGASLRLEGFGAIPGGPGRRS